ncbi:MAG: hypothetical protein OEM19_06795, partial [Deltaproteobacteria bacterium]|nr:hypothetical protein [Deltaproteobacteria bacterium]
GSTVYPALAAASMLLNHGVCAEVIDGRFVKPIDDEIVASSAGKTGKVITVEENVLAGGFGSGVVEILADRRLTGIKYMRLGINDRFLEHGSQEQLRQILGIDARGIYESALLLLEDKKREEATSDRSYKAEIGKII